MSRRELAARVVRYSGIPFLVRQLLGRGRPAILVYHDPSPETLDRHLRYLRPRYPFVTLDQVVAAVHAGDVAALPKRALAVTLDDGHAGNACLASVFRRHGVRPTIFLCSQIVGTRRKFWFDAGAADATALMRIPHSERLRHLDSVIGFREDREFPDEEPQALSCDDLKDLSSWADVGSHTRFHPILTTCDDEQCEREIVDSKREIEAITGRECRHFAFPNGDYDRREVALARRAGYRSARTVDVGWIDKDADVYRLRILGVTDDASIPMLAVQLSGVAMYLRYALRGNWKGRSPKNLLSG